MLPGSPTDNLYDNDFSACICHENKFINNDESDRPNRHAKNKSDKGKLQMHTAITLFGPK